MTNPVNYLSLEEGNNPFRDRDDEENEEGGVIIHQVPETKGNVHKSTSKKKFLFLVPFLLTKK